LLNLTVTFVLAFSPSFRIWLLVLVLSLYVQPTAYKKTISRIMMATFKR
jgi:hypothetical protein